MMLQRIMIADDEAIQRNMLSKILKRITPDSEITTCANGQEAYDAICESGADLLITDISMPVMDGLELIRRVSEEFPKTRVVLISAYQEFDYAKKAIRYGVKEYLIKPFRVDDARKLIERIEEELCNENEKEQRLNQYDIMLEVSRKQEYGKNLYRLVTGAIKAEQLSAPAYDALRTEGVIAVIRWKVAKKMVRSVMSIRESQQEILIGRLNAAFSEAGFLRLESGLDQIERRVALLIPKMTADEVTMKLGQILNELKQRGIFFWGGVSESRHDLLKEAAKAFQQAEEALLFCFYVPLEGKIFPYGDYDDVINQPMLSVSPYEKKLRGAVCRGEPESVKKTMRDLQEAIFQGTLVYPSKVRHRISSMVVSISKELEGMMPQAEYDRFLNEVYQRFGQCDSAAELFQVSEELLQTVTMYFFKSTEAFDAVESAISYIKSHLEEEISVQSLADQFHFHPNYLSVQIKNRTGESCANYILSLRMEEARRMLVETGLRIVEIAGKCGFKDSSYFNRVFKRTFELSPEQYRKVHKTC